MKAVILAAKASDRLFPFEAARPKCMLNAAGHPLLQQTLLQLQEVGVSEVMLVVGHQQEVIRQWLESGARFGMQVSYLQQSDTKGIGAALQLVEKALQGESFLLAYGDVLASGNPFSALLTKHAESGSSVAALALPKTSGEFGTVYMGKDMCIQRFEEKPHDKERANHVLAGFYLLEAQFFSLLKESQLDMVACLNKLVSQGRLYGTMWEGEWMELYRPWHLLEANRMLMRKWHQAVVHESARLEGNVHLEGPVHIAARVHIRQGSVLCGPCWVGAGCYIGNNTLIREYTAIGENSVVGYGSELKNSVLLGKVNVGRLSFIAESVIGERTHVGTGVTTVNTTPEGGDIVASTATGDITSGMKKLGAFIGDDVWLGARHILSPGACIVSGSRVKDLITLQSLIQAKD